ncbi:MAG: sugar phosphate isomerase/epimerase [Butyricicoccus porcorum]|nr:sugar phosphate isomerase/epimerase [Butyricicoccus porcorum]
MQIGISTASFYPKELEHGIEYAAQLGYRRVELFINSESEYGVPFRRMLKQKLRELGLAVVSVHPFTSAMEGHLLFSDYARRTRDALDQYTRYFEAAADLGAKYFTFHGELLRSRGLPPARADEQRFETYHKLCERASACGIAFTQENVSWCKSSDLAFLRALYDHVPELRFTLDIKQARRAGLDWSDYADAVGDRTVNLHISDYDTQSDCLMPGQGKVDFSALFGRMEALGCGSAMVEVYSDDYTRLAELEQSRLFLQSAAQRGLLK